ncbi:SMP-30/gluconolactonase/LRE family protein [Domibacillus sp. PGB-M46]|uniref:SMP-30/gluconolactonase/LRE family protein n=1 Tax=Domibacillus sp. PGB-M46 TaxID=2910255 RepID=UPI001F580710|nr:SMP-30/gluconolactonase/LRE family protein [Domibacillus sp. PGB-M46]MCI2256458.1 SMP-30/gluconolactonase/LRE family protein [Domibacillus sp. PGB-M46]
MEKNLKVEKVQGAALLEGPFWDEGQICLFCVDILNNKLIAYDVEKQSIEEVILETNITSVILDQNHSIFLSLRDKWGLFDKAGKFVKPLVYLENMKPSMRFNDGKVDPYGRFWLGTMSEDDNRGEASLYLIDHNGKVTESKKGITISNGLAWNKEGTMIYTIDTPSKKIMSYPFSEKTEVLKGGEVVFDFTDTIGSPDGMTIDENDHLWVALWGGGRVVCIDPQEKKVVDQISLPVTNVTSCTFGDHDFKTLYITTASEGLSEEQHKREPLAGSLFSYRLNVAGAVSRKYKYNVDR